MLVALFFGRMASSAARVYTATTLAFLDDIRGRMGLFLSAHGQLLPAMHVTDY